MKIVIVGNGIIGLTTAYRLTLQYPKHQIVIVGPFSHRGCASLAAAAMLNSFCEVDPHTLENQNEKTKFLLNRAAVPYWPEFINELEETSGKKINSGFGTFLVNNHKTDELEDESFDAVVSALKEFKEPHNYILPTEIPNYKPNPSSRASRAIFIPNEGWVNPIMLIEALKTVLLRKGTVTFIDDEVKSLKTENNLVQSVLTMNNGAISGDEYLLAPGANFSKIIEQSDLNVSMPRIFYGVGCSILLKTDEYTHSACVRTPNRGLACGIYSAPFNETHTIVGASNFISPVPEDFSRLTSVHTLVESAMDQINTVFYRSQLVKVNVGWRPTSQDTIPLIGKTSIANLTVCTGTKRDGLHCSPLISKILSNLLGGNSPGYDISLFRPERSSIRVYSREEAISTAVKHTINAAYQHGFQSAKNRMVDDLIAHYTSEFTKIHDNANAKDWGIPPEMLNMYKYGHIK